MEKGTVLRQKHSGVLVVATGKSKTIGDTTHYQVNVKGSLTYLPSYYLEGVEGGVDPYIPFLADVTTLLRFNYHKLGFNTPFVVKGVTVVITPKGYKVVDASVDPLELQAHQNAPDGIFTGISDIAKWLFLRS